MNYLLFGLLFISFINSILCIDPHIILFAIENLGYNDVGFHGYSKIPTPNIDALAYSGLILNNYYTYPSDKESIGALFTGKYPISGIHESPSKQLNEKFLPEYFEDLSIYKVSVLGGQVEDLWTEKLLNKGAVIENQYLHEKYPSSDFAFKAAREIIRNYKYPPYNSYKPLLLCIGHRLQPLEDAQENKTLFHITDMTRRRYAINLKKLDTEIGKIINTLASKQILFHNCVIVFTSVGRSELEENMVSNYPLRGHSNSIWEGGVKGTAFIWTPLWQKLPRISNQQMQIVDWIPTLLDATSGDSRLLPIDAISIYNALRYDLVSYRMESVHKIDKVKNQVAITQYNWKLISADIEDWKTWMDPNATEYPYNFNAPLKSLAGIELHKLKPVLSPEHIRDVREKIAIKCEMILTEFVSCENGTENKDECKIRIQATNIPIKCNFMEKPCLFDIEADPCEINNRADEHPEIVSRLLSRIEWYTDQIHLPTKLKETPNRCYFPYVPIPNDESGCTMTVILVTVFVASFLCIIYRKY